MNKKTKIWTVVIIVVIAALAFYGGDQYASAKASAARGARFGGAGFATGGAAAGAARGVRAGGGTSGQVLSVDSGSITVKLPTGGSQIVLVSTSTAVMKSTAGSLTDIQSGNTVTVIGSTNSDGSISANTIQIRPPMMQAGAAQQQ